MHRPTEPTSLLGLTPPHARHYFDLQIKGKMQSQNGELTPIELGLDE